MQEDTHVCVSESLINYNPDRKINWEGMNPVQSIRLWYLPPLGSVRVRYERFA